MNDSSHDGPEELQQVIADYLEAVDSGAAVDRDELLEKYPELSEELREFFATHDKMEQVAAPSSVEQSPTVQFDLGQPAKPSAAELAPTISPDGELTVGSQESSFLESSNDSVRYFGDYELLEEIARGGMGVVYKARQVNLDRTVALKMILSGRLASDDDVRRFHQEAESAANLHHPGIVPIYEIGEHRQQHFFSMAFVDGPSLAEILADGPLPPREAAQIVQQVLEQRRPLVRGGDFTLFSKRLGHHRSAGGQVAPAIADEQTDINAVYEKGLDQVDSPGRGFLRLVIGTW